MSAGATALVGATGLVGSNLRDAGGYDLLVHSRNNDELRGGAFTHVVFSAAKAEKWRANADPAADDAHIDDLIDLLGSFTAERLTLISTIDVLPSPRGADESTALDPAEQHQYGAGRHRLELAARALHERVLVARLPGLFGRGLKKNVLFDLLHDNGVEKVQPESSFQYYDLGRLHDDLGLAWNAGHDLVHLVTEPVSTAQVVETAFEAPPLPARPGLPVVRYDVRTLHAETFGGADGYIESSPSVLQRLRAFVGAERAR